MKLNFNASEFEANHSDLCIGFSEENDGEHYFIMQRDDSYIEEDLPNVESIYSELDDQCWGGNGGIDWVTLSRNKFIIHYNSSSTTRIGYDEIEINFSLKNSDFQELRNVLQKIMRGYEDKLNFVD
ncbi:hypothetical protein ACE1CI_11100 [Aerosakkonemataceae cyanobacterium BLCC-F50]|uniref:Uncharacterized protein n=1 Tax=Floridaenema flaviceps BLCC-F50 TaxID=3153642 RepID=A0ABV4XR58_9CYAN